MKPETPGYPKMVVFFFLENPIQKFGFWDFWYSNYPKMGKWLFKMDDFIFCFFFLIFGSTRLNWNQDSGFLCKEVVDIAVFEGVADLKPGTPEFHQALWGMDQIYSTEKQGWSGLKTTSGQTLVVFFVSFFGSFNYWRKRWRQVF